MIPIPNTPCQPRPDSLGRLRAQNQTASAAPPGSTLPPPPPRSPFPWAAKFPEFPHTASSPPMKRSPCWGPQPPSPRGDTEQRTRRTRLGPPRAGIWGDNRHCFTPRCGLAGSSQTPRGCELPAPPQPLLGWGDRLGTPSAPRPGNPGEGGTSREAGSAGVPAQVCAPPAPHGSRRHGTAAAGDVGKLPRDGSPSSRGARGLGSGDGGSVPPNPAARALPWQLPAG